MATGVCVQKVFLSGLLFCLTFEPNSRALLSGHFGPFALSFQRLACSCPVISDCPNTSRVSVRSFRTGLSLFPNTSRVPVRPLRTASTPRVSLSGHFGLLLTLRAPVLSFWTVLTLCVFLSGHFGFPRLHLRVLLSGHFGHSLIRHFFIFMMAREFRA